MREKGVVTGVNGTWGRGGWGGKGPALEMGAAK